MLPDEIFLEIFKYLKSIHLDSFVGHNRRINNIIRDVKVNILIECNEKGEREDFDYVKSFLPNQFIRLELGYFWNTLDLNSYTKLRSLKIDCTFLLRSQFHQVSTVNLPYLERFALCNVPYSFGKILLSSIFDSQHFPSLKVCQFSGKFYYMLNFNKRYQSQNCTIRTLMLSKWNASMMGSLLNFLPNLRRFETRFSESINKSLNFNMYHISLEHLHITLVDPSNDLEKILPHIPNLKQLCVIGKISEHSILKHFEKLSKVLQAHTPGLQKFDCELYCYATNDQVDTLIIQQLHSLFQLIKCHLGRFASQCYATNLTTHTTLEEFACKYREFSSRDFSFLYAMVIYLWYMQYMITRQNSLIQLRSDFNEK
ncbi:unnamed protein product [Rotaria sp. Silwood1]|nr:unnamed protein product [Rotaria sp. Silwood1]